MLKRHEIQVLRRAAHTWGEIAALSGVSEKTARRIAIEDPVTTVDNEAERARRQVGRPSKAEAYREVFVQALMEDPGMRSVELLHRARLAGYTGGKSAVYALAQTLRVRTVTPLVRFEGLPSEFSQHDFGEVWVTYQDGTEEKVHFFASRLKYSRWVEVTLVSDERVETLVRALVEHLAAFGGIPLVTVFDRPKTIALKWGRDGVVTEWNPTFAGVALDLGIGVEVCWPSRPQEKGSVENLVGWVKGSFFKQRRFLDRADLERQLREWLTDANMTRPSRATGVPPAARITEDRARLRPLKIVPAELALRIPVSVSPTAVVIHDGHPYSMPPDAIGLPGTLYLYRDRVRIIAGRFSADHARQFQPGDGSILPEHRAQRVAAVSGKRARRYLQRQHLLDLGAAALAYLTELTHRRPRAWIPEVERLHALLQTHGDAALRAAFERGLAEQAIGAEYIAHYLGTPMPALPFDDADRPSTLTACPPPRAGRRRRPQGRSAAEGLDAAEHGGIHSPRRRPVMMAAEGDLDALFKRLHLANARRVWRGLIDRAERERWSYRDFLTLLTTEEIAHRQQTRLARLTRRARFPFLKTIDDFNFTYQSALRLQMLGSALTADFVTEGRSLILAGKPGRGKTHLAIAIAYRAIQNGFDAFFTTAATLIDDLSAAFRTGELAHALQTYTHPAVLVVDEVGYLTYGTDAANMLFHVVNERHRRHRPMIFTTNKSLKAWGRVLHDDDLAQAILDRVLERGRLLRLDGPSVRTLHVNLDEAMKEDSDQEADLVRISGKRRSEFPEPTSGWYEDLKLLYEHFSHGVSFDSTDEIAQRQLNDALLAWLDQKAPEYNFDAERVTRGAQGGINDWMDRFIISVSGEYPAFLVEAFRKFRDEVHVKIRALFEEELRTMPHRDFEYWFKREREAGARAILQARWLYEKRMHEMATGLVPFTYENVYQSNGLDQFNLIIEVLRARCVPDDDLMPTLSAFLASDEFKDYPMSRISTLVWAAIGQAAANGQNEPPNAGTSNDIRVLSLAPYCDAMFVDNGCRALWMKIPTKYRKPYKAKMFSYNTRQEFLTYLRDIQDHADPAIVECVHQVYGEPTPFFTMYEYDRNRRQHNKEAKGREDSAG